MNSRLHFRFARLPMLGALAAALGLTGCGRKGPLDPPPAALTQPGQAAAAPEPVFGVNPMARDPQSEPKASDSSGRPIAPKGAKKPLPLDWLLD